MAIKQSFKGEPSQSWGEMLVDNEYYYVLLLIDSSQSMLWPFLVDQNNKHNDKSTDYINAIKKVQKEITEAHDKALSALKASRICKDRYLKVYQYLFNHRKKLINLPEELSPVGRDKVVKLTATEYKPESTTALYDVIHEALLVVEEDYLKQARENDKRPDKLVVGVITDGEDTVLDETEKTKRISEIKKLMMLLRNNSHLDSSVLIGLTSADFTKQRLNQVKEELTFDEAISIDQSDDKAIRKAFKLFSTDAAST